MMITPFGTAPGGEPVFLIKLDNGIISCEIITFGATIRSVVVPDHNGNPVDVVLGYDTLEEYVHNGGYLGATIGRFANRIAGGSFQLNGHTYKLEANNGRNHLHGGRKGFPTVSGILRTPRKYPSPFLYSVPTEKKVIRVI